MGGTKLCPQRTTTTSSSEAVKHRKSLGGAATVAERAEVFDVLIRVGSVTSSTSYTSAALLMMYLHYLVIQLHSVACFFVPRIYLGRLYTYSLLAVKS